jgi:hypothetical protein
MLRQLQPDVSNVHNRVILSFPEIQMVLCRKAFVVILSSLLATAAHAQWRYVDLHPGGATYSVAWSGASGNIGGAQDSVFEPTIGDIAGGKAVFWQAGAYHDLTPTGAQGAIIYGTDGTYSGGQVCRNNIVQAAQWTGTSNVPAYYVVPGQTSSNLDDVLGTRAVGYAVLSGNLHPIYWQTSKKYADFLPLGWQSGIASGIDGTTEVGWCYNTANVDIHACSWSGSRSSFVDLHPNGWDGSEVIKSSGNYAIGSAFQDYPTNYSYITGMLWDLAGHTHVALTPNGYVTSKGRGIYNQIAVGQATDPSGIIHAYMWNFTPTPQWLDLSTIFPAGVYNQSEAYDVWWSGPHIEIYGSAVVASTGQRHAIEWIYDPPA